MLLLIISLAHPLKKGWSGAGAGNWELRMGNPGRAGLKRLGADVVGSNVLFLAQTAGW